MSFKEFLFESPQMIDPTSFQLEDETRNRNFAKELIAKRKEIIIDSTDYQVFRTGNMIDGYIVMINLDDTSDIQIKYLVNYKSKKFKEFGKVVTQIALWRKKGASNVPGMTHKIFFGYLLNNFDGIMSDRQQTPDGRDFWKDRMAEAYSMNFKVGLFHELKHQVIWFDPLKSRFEKWLKDNDAWGSDNNYKHLRYIITN